MVLRRERTKDLGVGIPNGSAIAIREVDAAGGQADVIEDAAHLRRRNLRTDVAIDCVHLARGLLDARAGFGTDVQAKLSRVNGGKEVASKHRDERETGQTKQQET